MLRSFKVLRSLRALRPLRVIGRSEALRLAVGSLFGALPAIINGLIVCSLVVFIYAIIGISFFKGRFWECKFKFSDNEESLKEKVFKKADCLRLGGTWTNEDRNFDNIFNAISLLCEIITTEGWLEVMYTAIDSKGIGI